MNTKYKNVGTSLYKIAEIMQVTPQAVYKWYSGKSLPTADKLVKLAKLLEISPEELLNEFSNPKL